MPRRTHYTSFARSALACLALFSLGCSDDEPSKNPSHPDGGHDAASEQDSGKAPEPPTERRGLADGIVGKPCSANSDCGSGTCQKMLSVVNTVYPGGYCSGACRTNDECGARGVCASAALPGRTGSCYLGCEDDAACRDGYICRVVSGVGRCVPGAKPLPDHVVGNACTSDADCGGTKLSCASALGPLPTPGGYCSQSCAIDLDCGEGGRCVNGINISTINSGICYRSCGSDAPCRTGYECRSLSGSDTDPGLCVPITGNDAGL